MATICANCRTENSETGRFCVQCGAPLAATAPAPPAGAAAPPPPPVPAMDSPPAPPPQEPPQASPPAGAASPVPPPTPQGPLPAPPAQGPPQAPPPAAAPSKGKGAKTVLLILGGLLLACCLLSAIAAVVFYWKKPAFLTTSVEGAKQRTAMAQLQSVGAALEAYRVSTGAYPPVNRGGDTDYGIGDFTDLERHLVPDYLASLPFKDPWGNPYLYGSNLDGTSSILMCMGSDGAQGDFGVPDVPTATQCFEDDLIWRDGQMVQYPEGEQRHCNR